MTADLISLILGENPKDLRRLGGGDINEVYSFQTPKGAFVIKLNSAELFPGMLQKEKLGLHLIEATKTLKTPTVIESGTIEEKQFLLLRKIEPGKEDEKFSREFGQKLAALHQHSASRFGLDYDNYIGSLVQTNGFCDTWSEFLITQRLQPMLEMAVNQGDINYVEAKVFDAFYKRLHELYPKESPSLLHGDLWSGNYLSSSAGEAVLIDPAVYYGHREMDIAMMHLFGGFSPALFDAYNDVFPLEKGWKDRIGLSQLYPLLVHVNLFGRSYWERTRQILEKF